VVLLSSKSKTYDVITCYGSWRPDRPRWEQRQPVILSRSYELLYVVLGTEYGLLLTGGLESCISSLVFLVFRFFAFSSPPFSRPVAATRRGCLSSRVPVSVVLS
jgi:hypothetical protein